jgi:hypothetical protein
VGEGEAEDTTMRLPHLHELNGWQRLWVVAAVCYFLLLMLSVVVYGLGRITRRDVVDIAMVWLVPTLAAYALVQLHRSFYAIEAPVVYLDYETTSLYSTFDRC